MSARIVIFASELAQMLMLLMFVMRQPTGEQLTTETTRHRSPIILITSSFKSYVDGYIRRKSPALSIQHHLFWHPGDLSILRPLLWLHTALHRHAALTPNDVTPVPSGPGDVTLTARGLPCWWSAAAADSWLCRPGCPCGPDWLAAGVSRCCTAGSRHSHAPHAPGNGADTRKGVFQSQTGIISTRTLDTWAENFESFKRVNSMRVTNGNFDSSNWCKRLGTRRLHEAGFQAFTCLHELPFTWVTLKQLM